MFLLSVRLACLENMTHVLKINIPRYSNTEITLLSQLLRPAQLICALKISVTRVKVHDFTFKLKPSCHVFNQPNNSFGSQYLKQHKMNIVSQNSLTKRYMEVIVKLLSILPVKKVTFLNLEFVPKIRSEGSNANTKCKQRLSSAQGN